MFDTKIAFIVRDDLPTWQRLNVVAFLATGIAAAAPEIIGERYVDAQGRRYGAISGQPMLIFAADLPGLQNVHRKGLERELTLIPYVHAMFATGHDEANRQVFLAEDAENLDLVGLALRGPKKAVDKAIKGLALHG
ncbi:DUF2000 domain-containing protein [Serratia marcescens]|uniref:DUF2000 domain-containing protein n=1 Tax=Serratia marcescens TaxID=615 RepID=UPI000744DC27|nr:DUF2000 domain-containing protein [Serratia marcescens]CVA84373.1 Uncharacterized protein conserved in bacteria [Serratia marcescens]CVB38578.1 Uncharacterized protein conserved in bacteria [Serratia marcescens]CVB50628.1 Uncharacterized protein conserved in bacteria [Serratia marcescens]CVC47874.1 Uncharacterized protein conserved in bacteria [Serratia marcescens]CVC69428.1 Uncharacterized protein conserved in bacteria [Serratia marcescens]